MPNHITNLLLFDDTKAQEVFDVVCPDGNFDFEKLIPSPPHMYLGNTSAEDEQDFPINWRSWHVANWGTKWNAYSSLLGSEYGQAFIRFQTAWTVPYPVLSAFANKFQIPFEHRYCCEGGEFWGIEKWGITEFRDIISRIEKDKNNPNDKQELCLELLGYDPDSPETE